MISLSAKLTALYAASLIVVSAGTLATGYHDMQVKMVQSLDSLLNVEGKRVFTHLATTPAPVTPDALTRNLLRTTNNSARLFQVEVRDARGRSLFRSANLPESFPVALAGPEFAHLDLVDAPHVRLGRFGYRDLTVLIATPMGGVDATLGDYLWVSGEFLAITVLISLTLGYFLSQVALRPLRSIAATAARVGSDNLGERIAVQRMDSEVGDLARLLNAMLDRIEESFCQIRQFTTDASHELKTPLSLIRLHAEALLAETDTDARENNVVAQLELVDRMSAMIEDLLVLARADSNSMTLKLQPLDPAVFLAGLRADGEVLAEAAGCSFSIDHTGAGDVPFDSRWIRQTLLNLLTNALRASPVGGAVTIVSRCDREQWVVQVTDQGSGVPDATRIFDRFFTTAESGAGLGLAICRSIVGLHGGAISARVGDGGRGLVVEFIIPRQPIAVLEGTASQGHRAQIPYGKPARRLPAHLPVVNPAE